MSNLKDEFAWHGSKLLMQMFVNNERKKKILDDKIGLGEIKWYSPLAKENFKEYKLVEFFNKNNIFDISKLNIEELSKIKAQWDAIGVAPDGTLILVEAKAHTKEFENNTKMTDDSIIAKLIKDALGDDPIWLTKYYQLGNRYTYLNCLINAGIKTRLVYIYFVDDVTFKKTSKEEWMEYIKNIKTNYPIPSNLENNTIHIYYDMWKEI